MTRWLARPEQARLLFGGMSPTYLKELAPHLPAVITPGGLRRYPVKYLEAVLKYKSEHQIPMGSAVKQFARTPEAQDLNVTLRTYFNRILGGSVPWTPNALTEFFNVTKGSVSGWSEILGQRHTGRKVSYDPVLIRQHCGWKNIGE